MYFFKGSYEIPRNACLPGAADLCAAFSASAHEIYLKDGTVVSGNIKVFDSEFIIAETPGGESVIFKEDIARIEYIESEEARGLEKTIIIHLKSGHDIEGVISGFETGAVLIKTSAGNAAIARSLIESIESVSQIQPEGSEARSASEQPAEQQIPETSPLYPMLDRWGAGLFYPGITAKYWTKSPWTVEVRGAGGEGIGVAGFRFCYNLPVCDFIFLYFGGEVDVSFFSVEDIRGWGLAFEGLAGAEYRLTQSLTFSADIGPAWVMAFDPPGGYAGGLDLILNVGLNYYFPRGK